MLGASALVAFVKATVVGTGVGGSVVLVGAGAVAGLAFGFELDEHAPIATAKTRMMSNRGSTRKTGILPSVVVAVPFAVFGVPLLVARLDLLLPVLRGLA